MTTPTTPTALTAFPKYSQLPPELRLKIIDEFLYSDPCTDWWYHVTNGMRISTYACVDREWNRVVELRLFKKIRLDMRGWDSWDGPWDTNSMPKELVDFGYICGKRPGRLSRIELDLVGLWGSRDSEYPNLRTLFHLFELMRDWDHQDREQQGLIELELICDTLLGQPRFLAREHESLYDPGNFPPVAVIGSIHEPRPLSYTGPLHPCTVATLCQKLPNVRHTSLTLPPVPYELISTEDFIDAMDSLRVQKPGITHLDLKTDTGGWASEPFPLLPIMQRLNASPSPWSDRLVSLEIDYNIVVEDFLRDASETTWPNLKKLKLKGVEDFRLKDPAFDMDEDETNELVDETGINVIGALITALPCMPKVKDVHVKILCKSNWHNKVFKVKIHLGNFTRAEKAGKMLHCGDKFVPDSTNGVAKLEGIELTGDVATELQDVVRSYARQELEVFACTDGEYWYSRELHRPCMQWNRQAMRWYPVFENDMDFFIYEMGQYWEEVNT